jgi:hypothetical protein
MLHDAHKGMEVMSAAANAVKDEQWGEAQRKLLELQQLIIGLLREVGEKQRDAMMAPKPDRGDRG